MLPVKDSRKGFLSYSFPYSRRDQSINGGMVHVSVMLIMVVSVGIDMEGDDDECI